MAGAFGPAPRHDWMAVARALGSDVPFFLAGTAALVEGTGERVTPAGAIPRWHVLVIKPPVAVSTAEAYRELDRFERPSRPRSGSISLELLEALQRAEFERVERLMANDFYDGIVSRTPEIAAAVKALLAAGAGRVLLAGSGSCVFTLAPDLSGIESIVERLKLPGTFEVFATRFGETTDWVPETMSHRHGSTGSP
jgi:4-diphosphocytidyl-2-C-methyl-D-erythritol kinase